MSEKQYVQVGVTALRGPTGEFLESVPLYIEVEKSNKPVHPLHEQMLHDVAGLFAEKYMEVMTAKQKKSPSNQTPLATTTGDKTI